MEKSHEEVYKVEMMITVKDGVLDEEHDVDDLIFNACKDAPFFIDKMNINKFKE